MSRNDIFLVDCPVSGGTARAADGTLTILSSGSSSALNRSKQILEDMSEKLFVIPGGIGAASNVKMVNQLLAGIHIAAASEAMGLALRMGLNTRRVYEIIVNAAGNSWMFENRVPHMLDNDWTPRSALDIFVKDMACVLSSMATYSLIHERELLPLRLDLLGFPFLCLRQQSNFIFQHLHVEMVEKMIPDLYD
jgi:3-hydroxyisobutyrate dehydrogenase-like beta-hydroxyacid dehydrogenase